MSKKTILFVCGHNAGRSQMAEAYVNHAFHKQNIVAISAGTAPSDSVNPAAIKALEDQGISTENLHPKEVTEEMLNSADQVFTMGCGVKEECLYGADYIDLALDDPHGKSSEEVKVIFDQLVDKINSFLK